MSAPCCEITIQFCEQVIDVPFAGVAIPGPPGPPGGSFVFPPPSALYPASYPGTAGQFSFDSTGLYLCFAPNSWMKFLGVS